MNPGKCLLLAAVFILAGLYTAEDPVSPRRVSAEERQQAKSGPAKQSTKIRSVIKGSDELRLDYQESGRADRFGNHFRYRARVRDRAGANNGRWAWDVFLDVDP